MAFLATGHLCASNQIFLILHLGDTFKQYFKKYFRGKKILKKKWNQQPLSNIWLIFFNLTKGLPAQLRLPRGFRNTSLKTLCFISTFISQVMLGQSRKRGFCHYSKQLLQVLCLGICGILHWLWHEKRIAQEIKLHMSICKKPLLKFNWVGLQVKNGLH